MLKVAIVGAGKVGSVLGTILVENGAGITCVVSRTRASARRAGRLLGCSNVSDSVEAIPASTDVVLIATPHAAVGVVASDLARLRHLRFKRLSVCHASGMLTAKVLAPLSRKGAAVFSFHPLQTFPRDFAAADIVPAARGIWYAVDGSSRALRRAGQLARLLDGKILRIEPGMRALYHAACVVASNHLTTLLSVLEVMYGRLGTRHKNFYPVFKPILMATLRNNERSSPVVALSGPVARGGVETVAGHFRAVRNAAPDLIPYFGTLTLETLKLAERKGSITRERALAMRKLVRTFVADSHRKEKR